MISLSTSEAAHVLGLSTATLKRLSLAGKLACDRSPAGVRSFHLQSLADFYRELPSRSVEELAGSATGRSFVSQSFRAYDDLWVALVLRRLLQGASLARAFDEILPALVEHQTLSVDFIERSAPLASSSRSASASALLIGEWPATPRLRMAAALLRGLGYDVPALARHTQADSARLIACTDPLLVAAIAPHAEGFAQLRSDLSHVLERMGGRLLVDRAANAAGDFSSLEEFFSLACIREGVHRELLRDL